MEHPKDLLEIAPTVRITEYSCKVSRYYTDFQSESLEVTVLQINKTLSLAPMGANYRVVRTAGLWF
jgi:hypothetical protein